MRKFEGYVKTQNFGSKVSFTFEVDDDATDEDIDQTLVEESRNYYEIGCKETTHDK